MFGYYLIKISFYRVAAKDSVASECVLCKTLLPLRVLRSTVDVVFSADQCIKSIFTELLIELISDS